jgi:uncharacterized protein
MTRSTRIRQLLSLWLPPWSSTLPLRPEPNAWSIGSVVSFAFFASFVIGSCLAVIPTGTLGAQDTTRLRWVPNPRVASGGWVSDPATHLRPETVAEINRIISALERETTAEIGVVVLDTLDGLEPGDAAFLIHRRWGVGKRARDNGAVLLWSPKMRRIHISVGYGLEGVITDAHAGRIQDNEMIPRFRRNEFDAGMIAGVQAIAAAARREQYAGLERAKVGGITTRDRIVGGAAATTALLALVAGVVFVTRRPPKCGRGHGRMRRLSETQDDALLGKEAVLEEQLGSMNYIVWVCDQCDAKQTVPRRRWFTQYEQCPKCKRRTVKKQSVQRVAPTYSSTGEREVTRTCKNCQWTKTVTEVIPVLVRSSSSGSSSGGGGGGGGGGGSSFGGGSSGGGGAGRSY